MNQTKSIRDRSVFGNKVNQWTYIYKEMWKDVPPETASDVRYSSFILLRLYHHFVHLNGQIVTVSFPLLAANFVLSMTKYMRGTNEYFDQVTFTDLDRDEAQQQVDKHKMKCVLISSLTSEIDGSYRIFMVIFVFRHIIVVLIQIFFTPFGLNDLRMTLLCENGWGN
ncbi:hypothetical protein RND81_14G132400 [Saponaria officinalis]|uniref:Uncharacterized protein n=1 Tax=Saponaria officinalis TaxID=3572 RepID=A0AAW1GMN2_SAPOF